MDGCAARGCPQGLLGSLRRTDQSAHIDASHATVTVSLTGAPSAPVAACTPRRAHRAGVRSLLSVECVDRPCLRHTRSSAAAWRSGAVTGRRGYPPKLRNGSPRRQVVTLWYPPRTIEYESRFPGKAAGRGVRRRWCPGLSACSAIPLPVRSPLSPPPHRSSRPRSPSSTLHVHSTHMHSTYSRLLRSPPPPPPHALSPSPPGACASRAPCPLPSSPPTRAPSVPRRAPPCRRRRYPVRARRPAPPSAVPRGCTPPPTQHQGL